MPTAEPTDAKIKPQRLAKFFEVFIVSPISAKKEARKRSRPARSIRLFLLHTRSRGILFIIKRERPNVKPFRAHPVQCAVKQKMPVSSDTGIFEREVQV